MQELNDSSVNAPFLSLRNQKMNFTWPVEVIDKKLYL